MQMNNQSDQYNSIAACYLSVSCNEFVVDMNVNLDFSPNEPVLDQTHGSFIIIFSLS